MSHSLLWLYCLTVDAYIIDQAGPKGTRFKFLSAANIQAIGGILQAGGAHVGGDHDTIHVDSSFCGNWAALQRVLSVGRSEA